MQIGFVDFVCHRWCDVDFEPTSPIQLSLFVCTVTFVRSFVGFEPTQQLADL